MFHCRNHLKVYRHSDGRDFWWRRDQGLEGENLSLSLFSLSLSEILEEERAEEQ